jgi:hypothetical protein
MENQQSHQQQRTIKSKKIIMILIIVIVILILGYFIFFRSGSWTLVGESTKQGKYRIDGFKSSTECLEKALELSQLDDYYSCGKNCIDDAATVDGIICKKYCGRGGCSEPKSLGNDVIELK